MAVEWEENGKTKRGPSWGQLVDQAARLVGADEPALLRMRGSDLQILEYVKSKKDGMQPLINWLNRNIWSNRTDRINRLYRIHRG